MTFRGRLTALALAVAVTAAPVAAQARTPAFTMVPAPRLATSAVGSADSVGRLFTETDLAYAAGFAAAALVLTPLDRVLANAIQDSIVQANHILATGSTVARLTGSPGALVISSAVYVTGRATGSRDVAETGLHTAESVFLADAITGVVKVVAGRGRPFVNVDDPYNFKFLGGVHDEARRSFPSGHTTSAFAAAAAATAEVGRHWPERKTLTGVVAYGTAGLVGISRMYNNKHWASDVAVGAAIGSFTGWKVVRYTQAHPNNTIDRIFLPRVREPANAAASRAALLGRQRGGDGVRIGITLHTR